MFAYNETVCIHITHLLLFLHILIVYNETKSHTLLFYSVLVLTFLNGQVYLCEFEFFFISTANKFLEKKMLYDSLVLILKNYFLLQLLQAWYLCVFSHFPWFFKQRHYSSTYKYLFKIIFCVFFLDLRSYQYMVLTKFFDEI